MREDESYVADGIVVHNCTHHSNARGGKPRDEQLRATPHHLLKWIAVGQPLVGVFENVPEFAWWGPIDEQQKVVKERKGEYFQQWLERIEDLGYRTQHRVLNAANFGSPQSRKRLFIQIRSDGADFVWPKETHSRGGKTPGTLPWRGAIEVLDLSQETRSIFGRKRPLSVKTRARIARGIRSRGIFWEPLARAVEADPSTPEAAPVRLRVLLESCPVKDWPESFQWAFTMGQHGGAELRDAADPMATIATGGALRYGEIAFQLPVDGPGGNGTHNAPRPLSDPLATIRASRVPHLVETPFLVPAHGERPGQLPRFHDAAHPLPTLPSVRQPDLVVMQLIANYNGKMGLRDATEVLPTITTHERHALFETVIGRAAWWETLVDVRMRMLIIRELARGQSFEDTYHWHGSPLSIRRQVGNAVDCRNATAIADSALAPIFAMADAHGLTDAGTAAA